MLVAPRSSSSGSLSIERDFVLLLTATIDIKGMPKAYPTVPEQRQEDYCNSLRYYLNNHPRVTKILFVENSGWPLDRLREVATENPDRKQVEFISLNANHFPRAFGKGYGENLLIEQGVLQSNLVRESSYIGKITGRIYLLNLTEILTNIDREFDCLCDFKEPYFKQITGVKDSIPYADTRFLVFRKSFYHEYIQPLHARHRQGCFYSEHQYRRAIELAAPSTQVLKRFPIEPRFSGIAGHFQGKNYDSHPERVKFAVRSLSRSLLPWLYL
ncbi:hypothetical protein V0288_08830 [Pannus brasiliensis CCIBt3594]|uniref:Uncharacterized protein n=1 Tax=Pannus brasiliensis CCIBt3594 TaxID=1427578 RepID=A0AAW9QHE6_9CHRO